MAYIIYSFYGAIGTACLSLLVFLVKLCYNKFKNDSITLKALCEDSYFRYCRYLSELDELTEYEYDHFLMLYNGYKAQGLNSYGDKMFEIIDAKSVKVGDDIG